MSDAREKLARYQAELLDTLHKLAVSADVEEVQRVAHNNGQPVGELDERMVHLAAELTKKWGVRR